MKRPVDYLKKNYKYIFRAFLFLITTSLIVYIFPREGKFRYEFQKGRPWLHENLFAPFDFPIYNSEKQLQDERDSTLKYFDPYFRYDSTVLVNEKAKFLKYYAEKQEEFITKETDENIGFSTNKKQNFIDNSDNFKDNALKCLKRFILKGIIEINEVTETL